MPHFRSVICIFSVLLQAGCASAPAERAKAPAASVADEARAADRQSAARAESRAVLFDVEGVLPILKPRQSGGEAILASGLNLGGEGEVFTYRVTYRLEAGDVFSVGENGYGTKPPATLGGQSFDQNVVLRLPELAGAPVSLGVTAEVRDQWLLAGETQSEREHANLEWSPGPASISMQWSGSAAAFDPHLALRCHFESTVRFPTKEAAGRRQALSLSGRQCTVAEDTEYAGIEAQAFGLGYVWGGTARESAARLRIIEPVRKADLFEAGIDPGYQLGLSHRRDFGALSAEALVAVRQAPVRPIDGGSYSTPEDPNWSANASLTWHLADASVSANWAQGVNPLWFVPDALEQRDRFGLALDLSRWMESVAPGTSPEFGLRWDWSRIRLPGESALDRSSLSLDVALLF